MKRYAISAAVGACCLAFSPLSSATNGFYLGLGGVYDTINGDFDGNSAFVGGGDVIIVPKIEGGAGWSILGGVNSGKFAGELRYSQSAHDGQWAGAKVDVDYGVLDIDFKYFFIADQALRPWALIGVNLDQVKVKRGTLNSTGTAVRGDAKYTGAGLNLGIGADYFFTEHVSVGVGAKYRFVTYDEAKGVSNSGTLPESLNTNGLTLSLDAAYHF